MGSFSGKLYGEKTVKSLGDDGTSLTAEYRFNRDLASLISATFSPLNVSWFNLPLGSDFYSFSVVFRRLSRSLFSVRDMIPSEFRDGFTYNLRGELL